MRMTGKILLAAIAVAALSGTAMAADLPAPAAPAPAAPEVVPATSWDGGYIGANVGYSWAESDVTSSTAPSIWGYTSTDALTGWEVGGQIGYLFHLSNNVVGGVEGSLDWTNQTGEADSVYTGLNDLTVTGITQTINWEGMIVGKLGIDVGGNILPYVDAGVAFANITRDSTNADPFPGTSNTQTQTGWTVGAGLEAQLADHVTGFVSYNYADYGDAQFDTGGTYMPTVHTTDNIVKVGLNYHF